MQGQTRKKKTREQGRIRKYEDRQDKRKNREDRKGTEQAKK